MSLKKSVDGKENEEPERLARHGEFNIKAAKSIPQSRPSRNQQTSRLSSNPSYKKSEPAISIRE